MKHHFLRGLRHGVPIMLGYFSVSFGFGVLCVQKGLPLPAAIGISASNLTSAGQVAGLEVIVAGGSLIEIVLCQLVINLRYALMSTSLSQKLAPSFTVPHRLLAAFGVTDEIFAVASSRLEPLTPAYFYGLIMLPFLGWTGGTALGAAAGNVLPANVTASLGLLLYGMFIAILVPPAKEQRSVLCAVVTAGLLSVAFAYLLPSVSSGMAIILSAVASAAFCAAVFPVAEEKSA